MKIKEEEAEQLKQNSMTQSKIDLQQTRIKTKFLKRN
jgi:hypothetical protein